MLRGIFVSLSWQENMNRKIFSPRLLNMQTMTQVRYFLHVLIQFLSVFPALYHIPFLLMRSISETLLTERGKQLWLRHTLDKGSFIYYVPKIFRKTIISYPLIRNTNVCVSRGKKFSFSENFANQINEWS